MRFNEFFIEASLFTRPEKYHYGDTVKVSGSNIGLQLLSKIKEVIPTFDRSEELEWVEYAPEGSPIVRLGNLKDINFKRPNGEYFTVKWNVRSIESALNHTGRNLHYNRGNLAEGILGAALTAKFIHRGVDAETPITINHIHTILEKATRSSNTSLKFSIKDKNNLVADEVVLILKLPGQTIDILSDSSLWENISDIFDSAIHYVNSKSVEKYSQYFYINGKADNIQIISDGISSSRQSKTDVKVTANGRDLSHLDLSLKAGSTTIGQQGSGGVTKSPAEWADSARTLFTPLGINPSVVTPTTDILQYHKQLYARARLQLDQLLQGTKEQEIAFVENLVRFIKHHISYNDPKLKIVNFDQGISSLHSFKNLEQKMFNSNINLGTLLGQDHDMPIIDIIDKNSRSLLVRIRFYLSKKKGSHYIEQGPLLKQLTKVGIAPSPQPNNTPT